MARVTLRDIERELQDQDEAWQQTRARLSADADTQLVLGEIFLEGMLAIDERTQHSSENHFTHRGV